MTEDRVDLSHVHQPVLVGEVLSHLLPDRGATGWIVDGTLGLGGHAEALLDAAPGVGLLGIDRDPAALELARARLARFGQRVVCEHGSYADIARFLADRGVSHALGVLLDLGLSSLQLDDPTRGFSFRFGDAPLDMRFDATSDEADAGSFLASVSEKELAELLFTEGDEPRARAVARAIVRARPLASIGELASIVRRHAAGGRRHDPATRAFQAIRIAVNDELGHLERGLGAAIGVLAPGGRLAVLAFQGGEERRVKAAFREAQSAGLGRSATKKPIRPTDDEKRRNPRSRATRLRVFVRATEGAKSS